MVFVQDNAMTGAVFKKSGLAEKYRALWNGETGH